MQDMGAGAFTFVSRKFYESLATFPISPTYEEALRGLLPSDWAVSRSDVWLMARHPSERVALQGFKIHVSATTQTARESLARVVPECIALDTSFKVAADPTLLGYLNSKRYGRGGSGKFMTIYPTASAFAPLIERIHRVTRDLQGPYVLSDRRFSDSRVVHYRYGGFRPIRQVNPDGTHTPTIQALDGKPVADVRYPYFALPDWVADPFPDVLGEENSGDEDSTVLNGRFEVVEALAFSNTGGIYKALDRRDGGYVVVKEARPFTNAWVNDRNELVDAVRILAQEYDMLRRLQHLPFVVHPVDFFEEWEHSFLVEEYVDGVPLTTYRAREEIILIRRLDSPRKLAEFCRLFRDIALRLIALIEGVHEAGVVLGDVSPNNLLINPETLGITLIDVESARVVDGSVACEQFAARWHTPGFRATERVRDRATPECADDYYALGMVLYSLVHPVQPFFDLAPEARSRFLDRFVDYGLDSTIRTVINVLLEGRAAEAKRALAVWEIGA